MISLAFHTNLIEGSFIESNNPVSPQDNIA